MVRSYRVSMRQASWSGAVALSGPDRERWVVGVAAGSLWRVTEDGDVEDVRARLGIEGTRVLAVDASGSTAAIGLADGVAVSRDGTHMIRFAGAPVTFVAAAAHEVALGRPSSVERYDLEQGSRVTYTVEDVSAVTFLDAAQDRPRLVVTAGEAVYVEDRGALRRIAIPAVRTTSRPVIACGCSAKTSCTRSTRAHLSG